MTPYQKHVAKWSNCEECELCERRTRVVLLKGVVPSPILFIGEAPGASEDVLGKPFVGPAGKLLEGMLEECNLPCSYAMTNLVACIPKVDGSVKLGEPPEDSILACADRLEECLKLCKPELVVAVGRLSEKWLPKLFGSLDAGILQAKYYPAVGSLVTITHPAAILRMSVIQKEIAIQRCIVTITDAVSNIERN
jgi:uracil-DNA glycosylase family 4